MGTVIFEYQTMMSNVLGNMTGRMIPTLQNVSYVLMAICLLLGMYESFAKGGDTRQLAASVLKYVVVAFIVGNWSRFFADTITGFNQMASAIDNSFDGWDLLQDWGTQLAKSWDRSGYTSIWNLISNGGAAIVNSLEIAIAYLIFPLVTQVFTLVYTFWGAVLYAVGPLVLALAPSRLVNSTAKFYAQNLIVWNCWSIVYAVFACLIAAVNGKDISSNPFFNGSIAGAQQQIFVGLTSILYSVCILLIPVISFFILRGEFSAVGGALLGLIATANQATRLAGMAGNRGSGSAGRTQTSQGGMGGGSYRNLSRPPDDTPPRQASI